MYASSKRLFIYFLGCFFYLISTLAMGQRDISFFQRINEKNGLPHPEVRSIFKDSKGFMWFATGGGVVRFDGYKFEAFKFNFEDPAGLSDDNVFDVTEDPDGNIWVSTYSGLNRFDRKLLAFSSFYVEENIKTSASVNFFLKSRADKDGNVWSIIADRGLFKFDRAQETFTEFHYWDSISDSISNTNTSSLYISRNGTIWFGKNDEKQGIRLFKFDYHANKLSSYPISLPSGPDNNGLYNMLEDSNGYFWLGFNNALGKFDPKSDSFIYYFPDESHSNSLPPGRIDALEEDSEGKIWIGTNGNGLARLNPQNNSFTTFKNDPKNLKTISSNTIISLYNDKKGILWVGTDKGLNQVSIKRKAFENHLYTLDESEISKSNLIKDLYTDREGKIWFCTEDGLKEYDGKNSPEVALPYACKELVQDSQGVFWLIGDFLMSYDPATKEFRTYPAKPDDPKSLSSNSLWSLYIDHEDIIWIGTGGGGLNGVHLKTGKVVHYLHDPLNENSITTNEVGPILRDGNDLWIGPYKGGLNKIDLKTGKINRYLPEANNPQSLSHDVVSAIHKDREGRLWVGTFQGVNILDQSQEKFVRLKEKDGLASHKISVNGITEDKNGNIWVATAAGLSKIHPKTLSIRNYDFRDGFQENPGATLIKNRHGRIYYFGSNGITAFNPEEIEDNLQPPQVSITDFLIFNKSIEPGTHPSLPNNITETSEIEVSYKESFLTFEFAAHNYYLSEKNQYAYKMEGFDEDWIYSGNRRYATYTNLPPGKEYTFRVKASNNDGIWNEEGASVKIYIIPPFWATWWFHTLLAIVFIVFLYVLYRWRTRQHYLQRKKLELMVRDRTEEVEAQKEALEAQAHHLRLANREIRLKNQKIIKQSKKLKLIDKLKSRFLANISHELRTPLTLILAPLEELISYGKVNTEAKEQLGLINRNAKRLLQLINQLLDLAKIEQHNMALELKNINLVQNLKSIAASFNYLAKKHKITYGFHTVESELIASIDVDKFEKIIFNLISNAFKFTPDGGSICIKLEIQESSEKKQNIKISVNDSGIGISPEHLPYIFDRFYQSNVNSARISDGTGIGLALAKELADLHGGEIQVVSEPNKGTCFTVLLPYLKPEQSVLDKTEFVNPTHTYAMPEEEGAVPEADLKINGKERPMVLLIEDNHDLRKLMSKAFSAHYQVVEAADGLAGWETANSMMPELIISDIMMPGKDGFALCQQLKSDTATSHIPTILITARVDAELEGLKAGADDYITKPFNTQSLILKVNNLIETRRKFREYICQSIGQQPIDSSSSSGTVQLQDKLFLKNASEIVLNHISDIKFEVEILYRELGMSRAIAYKKLKALTGLSPNEFIRHIRLNKAAQLLGEKDISIKEVMDRVGFNHRSYFINCFKKQFGQHPNEFDLVNR